MHKIEIQINPRVKQPVDTTLLTRAIVTVLNNEHVAHPVTISVLITDDATLQRLNLHYRNIDAPTDVLSFASEDDSRSHAVSALVNPTQTTRYLGDIAISYDRVVAQATEYHHSRERELAYLTVHGVLHLLGYDHERGEEETIHMRTREEAAMKDLDLQRES